MRISPVLWLHAHQVSGWCPLLTGMEHFMQKSPSPVNLSFSQPQKGVSRVFAHPSSRWGDPPSYPWACFVAA